VSCLTPIRHKRRQAGRLAIRAGGERGVVDSRRSGRSAPWPWQPPTWSAMCVFAHRPGLESRHKLLARGLACQAKTILLRAGRARIAMPRFCQEWTVMLRVGGRMFATVSRVGPPNTRANAAETHRASGRAACRRLNRSGDHGGNCEARLFFAFVGPVFRLVNEHAAGLALIGSGRAYRTGVGAGATNAGEAVRTQR
jgi:hypothetical protein